MTSEHRARTLKPLKLVATCLAVLLAIPLLYLTAAVIGAAVPANAHWQQAGTGVTIYIRTNGVHTWVMVPAASPQWDWRPLLKAEHLKDPRYAGEYLAIGWGNREFYLNTPTWSDLTVGRAFGALFGNGPSLMHVDHEPKPRVDGDHRPIVLTPEEYARLTRFLLESFQLDAGGQAMPLKDRGYDRSDVFYEGRGFYNLFVTCNEWTGAALRSAGVRTGIWTPFEQSILLRLSPPPA